MNERDEILQRWRSLINELRSDWTKWERHTLKEYILQCAELVALQIEYKILDIQESQISTYLFKELNKEGIEVSDRYLRQILPDNYKRNYSKSEHCSDFGIFTKVAETQDELIAKSIEISKELDGKISISIFELIASAKDLDFYTHSLEVKPYWQSCNIVLLTLCTLLKIHGKNISCNNFTQGRSAYQNRR